MARGDMSNFGLKLQNQNKKDIQKRISRNLAAVMGREQKKEGKWRGLSGILKTAANLALPGLGGAAIGAVIDPIGRSLGQGADLSKLKAGKGNTIFGGREGYSTARRGLEKSLKEYRDKTISDSVTGAATGTVLKGLSNKLDLKGKLFGKFGKLDGGGDYADMLEDRYNPLLPLIKAQGGMVQKFAEGGFVAAEDMDTEELIAALKAMGTDAASNIANAMKNPMWAQAMIEPARALIASTEGTGINIDEYTPEGVTEGIDKYAKTENTAELVETARGGGDGAEEALDKLAEIARATRPELANKNYDDLKEELKKNLMPVDMYGGAYQDVNTKAAQQIQGMKKGASAAAGLAYNPSGQGASQRGARLGQQTLSSGLQDIYSNRAAGREDAVTQSFSTLDNAILNISS
jgi:hypothetical protein